MHEEQRENSVTERSLSRWQLPRIVLSLGITQIISWGSLYYCIAVLAEPMAASLGVGKPAVFGALSLALAVSGLVSPAVGRAIDRYGGRAVMSAGSMVAAMALVMIALADGVLMFALGWALVGIAMAATLYDAAFPALSQLSGQRYRQALTALTLFGGLASTVFWPLSWQLSIFSGEHITGWRFAFVAFAAMHFFICLPLHRWGLPRADLIRLNPALHASTAELPAGAAVKDRRFLWLALSFALNAFVFSAVAAHVVAALVATGQTLKAAVFAAALIGPMQVAGRIAEFALARRWPASQVGVVCLTGTILAMLLLWQAGFAPWVATVFALLYGASNGVMTIVRGMVPGELFGRERYGRLMGALAQPSFFAKASAPLLASLLLAAGISYPHMALGLCLLSFLALLAFLSALRAARHFPQGATLKVSANATLPLNPAASSDLP